MTIADLAGMEGVYMMGLPRHVFIGIELRLSASSNYTQDIDPFPESLNYCFQHNNDPLISTCVVFIDSYYKGTAVHPQEPIESTSYPCTKVGDRRYIRFASLGGIWLRSLRNLMNMEVSSGGDTHLINYSVMRQFYIIQSLFGETDQS